MKDYQKIADEKIRKETLSKDCNARISQPVKDLLEKKYVIDVHTHIFDIKCINKSYFIIRNLKDLVGLKSGATEPFIEFSEEEAYKGIQEYDENWEKGFKELLSEASAGFKDKNNPKKGLIDYVKASKLLTLNSMEKVYQYYIKKFSLAKSFASIPDENTLTTALMMDLEMGWGVKVGRSFYQQMTELKDIAKKYPVLPFLYCDPRRADKTSSSKNLYDLFNAAFCQGQSFFGIKIYPALGYDPADYRLWPIYELCQEYSIPVLSHCGGESVSTDELQFDIFRGDKKENLHRVRRQDIAYALNDPSRWKLVLEKFPNLKLNLAHFGGYETWRTSSPVEKVKDPQQRKETIFKLMEDYPNVYADFSFNIVEEDLSKNLINVLYFRKDIRERSLFGSDFWVVNKEGNLQKDQTRFVKQLKDASINLDLVKMLTYTNPKRYLFG